jgi:peptidoglycan/LPS O-acetylase OafA/YrhL
MRKINEPARRENNFGFLRLLFATLVILAHSPELVDGNQSREILTRLFGTISFGRLAVDGFFLISGYLITNSWERCAGLRDFLLKRILRIYPGFIVAFAISLLIVGPLSGGRLAWLAGLHGAEQFCRMVLLRGPQLAGAFPGLHDPQLNSSMWTIAYEFRCYIVTAFAGAAGLLRRRNLYLGVTIGLLVLDVLAPAAPVTLPVALIAVLGTLHDNIGFLMVFFCGGSFYLFRDKIPLRAAPALAAMIGAGALLTSKGLAEPGLAILGGYALFWFSFHAKANALSRIDNRIDLSYGLYLYAWPVQNLIILWCPGISPWVLFMAATVVASALGAASWILVERPFMNMRTYLAGMPALMET